MKWPAVVRFENSDELEIIDSQSSWDAFLQTVTADCELILSDGALINLTTSSTQAEPLLTTSNKTISVDTAVELARRHMAAQAHCCIAKFNAPSVEAVITALMQLED